MKDGDDNSVYMLERAVPKDQRPINELQELKEDTLYSWGSLDIQDYIIRLAGIAVFFGGFIGGPIASQSWAFDRHPAEWLISVAVGSLIIVSLVVIRIFLGWSYVSDRLLSATYPYEETGWYDGQVFVKPPEILARDRLLGTYEAKPVLAKLKGTLIGSGTMLLTSALLLYGLIQTDSEAATRTVMPPKVTQDGVIFSSRVKDLSQLKEDDELAALEAAASGPYPGYCRDRMLRAVAGTANCEKYDSL